MYLNSDVTKKPMFAVICRTCRRNFHKKKEHKAPVGIKNSWKYEKDLVIILNAISVIITITQMGNLKNYPCSI